MPPDPAPLFLGLDVGTQSVRAALFDPRGTCRAFATAPLDTGHPHPGWAEQEAAQWWQAARAAVPAALARAGVAAADVAGGGAGPGQGLGHGVAGRLPPLLRVLLGPAGVGVGGVEGGGGEGPAVAGRVEEGGPQALRADVQAEEEGRGGSHGRVVSQTLPRLARRASEG